MAGGGGGAPQQGDDNAMNILWGIVGIFILIAAIWIAFSEQLKLGFIKLRVLELTVINFIIQLLPLKWINLEHLQHETARALAMAKAVNYHNLTLDMANYLSVISGSYLKYPVIICLVIFSYYSFFRNVTNKYKKRYSMQTLVSQEKDEWPQINPVVGLDLVKESLELGPWAMANTPLEFAKKNNLIEITVERASEFKHGNPINYVVHLEQEKTELIFIKQLGKLWRNPANLPIHQRAILSILLARACRESVVANDFAKQINRSISGGAKSAIDFSGVDTIWPKYFNKNIIQDIVQAHAYEFTVFIDLLLLARQDGVLATADFLWLKPMDRLFWYVLNSAGRQTYFSEAAGVHAHFLVEKSLGRALSVPNVKEAVKALQLALNDIIYVPTEEEKEELLKSTNQ